MIDDIKQRIEDLKPICGNLVKASRYVRDCEYLIGELKQSHQDYMKTAEANITLIFLRDDYKSKSEKLQKALEEIAEKPASTFIEDIARKALK